MFDLLGNHAWIHSWNQPVLSNEGSWLVAQGKQWCLDWGANPQRDFAPCMLPKTAWKGTIHFDILNLLITCAECLSTD